MRVIKFYNFVDSNLKTTNCSVFYLKTKIVMPHNLIFSNFSDVPT